MTDHFPFELEIDLSRPVKITRGFASISLRLRHFSSGDVILNKTTKGSINLGFRLISRTDSRKQFEDRVVFSRARLPPNQWASGKIQILGTKIELNKTYKIQLDMVAEELFWFSQKGSSTFEADISFEKSNAAEIDTGDDAHLLKSEISEPSNIPQQIIIDEKSSIDAIGSESLKSYQDAVNENPAAPQLWLELAEKHINLGEFTQAEIALRRSMELAPTFEPTVERLAYVIRMLDMTPRTRRIEDTKNKSTTTIEAPHKLSLSMSVDNNKAPASPRSSENNPQQITQIKSANARTTIIFDVSDLINYFEHARLPTGIQRVQIEVITSLIFENQKNRTIKIVAFTKTEDSWVSIPLLFFNHICKLSVLGGEPSASDWQSVLGELRMHLIKKELPGFTEGAFLVNLGTSWWLQNYFLHVRRAKAEFGIKYVPFVHDCIPVVTPEHCVENLTRDFISWITGVFFHADHIFVNSNATSGDVQRVANFLGFTIEMPKVIKLDADFRAATEILAVGKSDDELLDQYGLQGRKYVLFVSTIESRKNHLATFSAWLNLCKKYGEDAVPDLVCVGNRGWLNDSVYSKISSSDILRRKVLMLSKIPDINLQALYRCCVFTVYPSHYEGWGLPVTESLCYGKVPLLSSSSSLPEAGGSFGEYFDALNERELMEKAWLLSSDGDYRQQKQQKIINEFRPRTWLSIANQISSQCIEWSRLNTSRRSEQPLKSVSKIWPFVAHGGKIHELIESRDVRLKKTSVTGEIFRQGTAWWWPEPWGCWTKPEKPATLAFLLEKPVPKSISLVVGVRGVQGKACQARLTVNDSIRKLFSLAADEDRWVAVQLDERHLTKYRTKSGSALIEMKFSCDTFADFREFTMGQDHRVAGIGVRSFMWIDEADVAGRLKILEALVFSDLSLVGRVRHDQAQDNEFLG